MGGGGGCRGGGFFTPSPLWPLTTESWVNKQQTEGLWLSIPQDGVWSGKKGVFCG